MTLVVYRNYLRGVLHVSILAILDRWCVRRLGSASVVVGNCRWCAEFPVAVAAVHESRESYRQHEPSIVTKNIRNICKYFVIFQRVHFPNDGGHVRLETLH